jgi:hypothetical protein
MFITLVGRLISMLDEERDVEERMGWNCPQVNGEGWWLGKEMMYNAVVERRGMFFGFRELFQPGTDNVTLRYRNLQVTATIPYTHALQINARCLNVPSILYGVGHCTGSKLYFDA